MADDGTVASLSAARKKRARAEKEAKADGNRAKFGRTKSEKARDAELKRRRDRLLDGAALDGADGDEPPSGA